MPTWPLSWINGHDEFSPAQLRRTNAKSPLVRDSEKAMRLLSCYIGIGEEIAYALQDTSHDLLDDPIETVMEPVKVSRGALELTPILSATSTALAASATSASDVQTAAKEQRGRSSTRSRASQPQRESTPEKKKSSKKKKGDKSSPTLTPAASEPHTPTGPPPREDVRQRARDVASRRRRKKGQPASASEPSSTTK